MKTAFDIIIMGGGMAGCSMALALNRLLGKQLKIAIIEKNDNNMDSHHSFDDRCIALSRGSAQILEQIGVWSGQLPDDAEDAIAASIRHIHISEQGKFGTATIDEGRPLGYVVESQALGSRLLQQIQQQAHIEYICPATVEMIEHTAHADSTRPVQLQIQHRQKKRKLSACLLIAADGAHSSCHQFLSRAPRTRAYQQSAIITNIRCEYPHQNFAYERFTPSGPLAVLPLTRQRCSVVWTVKTADEKAVLDLDDAAFREALQEQFGYRLGRIIQVGKRFSYPLVLKQLDTAAASQLKSIIFIGNAAHAIHPVAGQGFNLGLRDIQVLSRLIASGIRQNRKYLRQDNDLCRRYWQLRAKDIQQTGLFTDGLIRIFSNQFFPLTPARNLALGLFDLCPVAKHTLALRAMGLNHFDHSRANINGVNQYRSQS